MSWTDLPTNYTDAAWSGLRKYVLVNNDDGTVSFNDVTIYAQKENSFFGAADANAMNAAMNELVGNVDKLSALLIDNAGSHNALYRGKNLGTSVTSAQWIAIENGTFADMYIGDYWVIDNITYRIAAFDYYYNTGSVPFTTHHVVIVPDESMYTAKMNETAITTGGYVGSLMYTANLEQAKTTISSAFGSSHILSHKQYLCNAVTNGKPSGVSWYDSTVELMTEQNVYGGKILGVGNDGSTVPALYTIDAYQFPLFAYCNPSIFSGRQRLWLRDIVSDSQFASINVNGYASCTSANQALGVRPSFAIKS